MYACLVPSRRYKCVVRPRQLVGITLDELERLAVLAWLSIPPQRKLGFRPDSRERRAQLVRELGRKAPLVMQARCEAVE